MAEDYGHDKQAADILKEILSGASSEKERRALERAWKALAPLACDHPPSPQPGPELAAVFGKNAPLGEDELSLLAAAGDMAAPADASPVGDGAGEQPRDTSADTVMRAMMEAAPQDGQTEPRSGADALDEAGQGDPELPHYPLSGDGGAEVFFIAAGSGELVVQSFTPGEDALVFEGLSDPDELDLRTDGPDTRIGFRGTVAVLRGVALDRAGLLLAVRPPGGTSPR